MAGYAAFGTVQRGRVSALPTVQVPSSRPVEDARVEAGAAMIEDAADEPVAAPRARLRDRLATAREQWSITTFYLFDPNSWR
jgi:hypothetical protein